MTLLSNLKNWKILWKHTPFWVWNSMWSTFWVNMLLTKLSTIKIRSRELHPKMKIYLLRLICSSSSLVLILKLMLLRKSLKPRYLASIKFWRLNSFLMKVLIELTLSILIKLSNKLKGPYANLSFSTMEYLIHKHKRSHTSRACLTNKWE